MLFDLALTFAKRGKINQAARAISAEDWTSLADLMSKGLSPNQRLPVSDLPGINSQGPKSTAVSALRVGSLIKLLKTL